MSEQTVLDGLQPSPRLTERQQFVLDLVEDAGRVDADDVGAALCARRGRHGRDDRCRWDAIDGKGALKELQRKGLVRYQRGPSGWVLADAEREPVDVLPPGMTTEIPY